MKKYSSIVLTCACFIFLLNFTVQASSISIMATIDGYAESFDGFSPTTTLIPNTNPFLLLVDNFGSSENRAALEFDISSIPSLSTIVSANFKIYGTQSDANIGLHGYIGDGKILTADFTLSNEIATFDPVSGDPPQLNQIDVTTFISNLMGLGEQYAGFQLRELLNEPNEFVGSTASSLYVPELFVEYASVPEPTTMLLLGLGLVGLAGVKRKIA